MVYLEREGEEESKGCIRTVVALPTAVGEEGGREGGKIDGLGVQMTEFVFSKLVIWPN